MVPLWTCRWDLYCKALPAAAIQLLLGLVAFFG